MTAHAPLVETGATAGNSTPLDSIPFGLDLKNGADRSFCYVTLPFFRAEHGILRGKPVEFRDCLAANVFARMLAVSAGNCGAIVLFQRHGGEDDEENEVFVVGTYGDVGQEPTTG